jgi:hypothetical protein
MDARLGGPAAEREPSPEGLGINPEDDLSARGRATKPSPARTCVIRSEAELSRRAVGDLQFSLRSKSGAAFGNKGVAG